MTNWSNKLKNLSKREKISLILILGVVVILIGVFVWALTTKKLSPRADVVNQIQNTATSTYKDAQNNNYSAMSNPVIVQIGSFFPTWQHTFTSSSTGWALVSFPHTVNKSVGEIFNLANIGDSDAFLHKYDPITQGYVSFTEINPSAFGDISWKDGLWISFSAPGVETNISYQSSELTTDQYVDLKGGGKWNMIGYPFTQSMLLDNVKVQELNASGNPTGDIRTFLEVRNNWIQEPIIGYDPVGEAYVNVSTTANTQFNKHQLDPWNGYWVQVFAQYGVRLTFPASAQIQAGGAAVPQGQSVPSAPSTKQKKK